MLDLPGDLIKVLETKIYSEGGSLEDLSSDHDWMPSKKTMFLQSCRVWVKTRSFWCKWMVCTTSYPFQKSKQMVPLCLFPFISFNSSFHGKVGDDTNIPKRQPTEASPSWLVTKSDIIVEYEGRVDKCLARCEESTNVGISESWKWSTRWRETRQAKEYHWTSDW